MTTPPTGVSPLPQPQSPDGQLHVDGAWLVLETGRHTCGAGHWDSPFPGAHEPSCGVEPVISVEELWALLRLTGQTVDPTRVDALPIGARDALVAHVLQWMKRLGYLIDAPGQPRTRTPEPAAMRLYQELTPEERQALPAECHRPVWDGMGTPHLWQCAVCWGDGWTTSWPCEPARAGGLVLARALGLDYHW